MGMLEPAPPADMGDEATEPAGEEPKDDFEREAFDFMDDSLPMATRAMALKEAIKLCAEKDYGSATGGGEKPKGDTGLALIFGGEPKKKK
jgi:hypothetical protein